MTRYIYTDPRGRPQPRPVGLTQEEVISIRNLVNEALNRPTQANLRMVSGLLAEAADKMAERETDRLR